MCHVINAQIVSGEISVWDEGVFCRLWPEEVIWSDAFHSLKHKLPHRKPLTNSINKQWQDKAAFGAC